MASTPLNLPSTAISSLLTSFHNRHKTFISSFSSQERALSSSFSGSTVSLCRKSNRVSGLGSKKDSREVACTATASSIPSALLFDCDGVLVDTEKDGHRISFNETFNELGVTWDVDLYGELLKIGGGKERMTAYFNKTGWPEKAPKDEDERNKFIASLHKQKIELFMVLIEKKIAASSARCCKVSTIVSCLLGPKRAEKILIFAGDVVPRKPDPTIYLLAASTLGVDPSSCVVVEDSAIGLSAAKAAGMKCIVAKSGYTADGDFANGDAVFDCIGDPPEEQFDWISVQIFSPSNLLSYLQSNREIRSSGKMSCDEA